MAGFRTFVPQYVVGRPLGTGGMGVVQLGTMVTPAGTRRVALKRILDSLVEGEGGGAPAKEGTERIVAEAKLVFQLTHANICQVLDLAVSDAGTFIVMEFINGLDLQALLSLLGKEGRLLEVPLAILVAAKIAEALDYAHHFVDETGQPLGLVHGDVTPKNILLSRDGEVKLADFGIARTLGSIGGTSAPGNQLRGGTPGFIAPEVAEGIADQRADVYALGVTLYVALSGASVGERIDLPGLRSQRPEVTADLSAILERATAPQPQQRFSTAGELEKALIVHLARHFPSVTRSSLVEVVRAHMEQTTRPTLERGATLKSLTRADAVTTVFGRSASVALLPLEEPGVPPKSADLAGPQRTERFAPASGSRKSAQRPLLLAGLCLALLGGAYATLRPGHRLPPVIPTTISTAPLVAPIASAIQPTPPSAGQPTPVPAEPIALPAAGTRAPVRSRAPRRHATAPAAVAGAAVEMGYLTVNAIPWGAVYFDGKLVADETPVYRLPVLAGKHRVTVSGSTREHPAVRDVSIAPGKVKTVSFR